MYNFVQKAHSGWAYLTILALLVACIYFIIKLASKKPLASGDKKFSLFALIATHIQFVLGLILLFVSPFTKSAFSDFGAAMKDSTLRLYAVEHPLTMLIAVVLVTIAHSKTKKRIALGLPMGSLQVVFFVLALLLILSRIPWSAWMG